jgi:hypothetical protein
MLVLKLQSLDWLKVERGFKMKNKSMLGFILVLVLIASVAVAVPNQWKDAYNFGAVPQPIVIQLFGITLPVGQPPINQTIEINPIGY